jgi:hypothetical protein
VSNAGAAGFVIAVVVLVAAVTAVVVRGVDRRRPPTNARVGQAVKPPSREARKRVMQVTAPSATAVGLGGWFGLGHFWAGLALAAAMGIYGYYGPQWLWRHVQRRSGAA